MRKVAVISALAVALGGASEATARTWSYSSISRGLQCIHRYEGSWSANTGNGYYGGLQMDWNFMRSYGSSYLRRWGSAARWPVWAQIDAGVRGAMSRGGFNPWPNTRRPCGLPYYF